MDLGERDKKILQGLYPPFQKMAENFLSKCWDAGLNAHLSQGIRSFEEEQDLFNKGFSHRKGGYSLHNYGLAFDIIFNDEGENNKSHNPYNAGKDGWEKCALIGLKCNLQPGYFWISFKDKPHYQARLKTPIEVLLAIHNSGTLIDVWKHLDNNEKEAFAIPLTSAKINS